MNENKVTFWGALDQSLRIMEDASPKFRSLWDSQAHRMTPEDIERMHRYLHGIQLHTTQMKQVLALFGKLPTNDEIEHAKS